MSTVVDLTEYVVRIFLDVRTTNIHSQLSGLNRAVVGLSNSITRGIIAPLAGIAIGSGLAVLTHQVINLHTEVQDATFGIAALYNAIAKVDMTTALKAARVQVKNLQTDAMLGAGEFEDYVKSFQMILTPSLNSGASASQVRELNRLLVTTSFLLRGREGPMLGAIDVAQALTSGVGQRSTAQVINQVLAASGISLEDFRGMSQTQKFQAILDSFHQFDKAMDLMAGGWTIQMDRFRGILKLIFREATEPLFDRWVEQLKRANIWLLENLDVIQRTADTLGGRMLGAYEKMIDKAPNIAQGIGMGASVGTGMMMGRILTGAALAEGGDASLGIGSRVPGRLLKSAGPIGAALAAVGGAMFVAANRWPEAAATAASSLGFITGALTGLADTITQGIMGNPMIQNIGLFLLRTVEAVLGGLAMLVQGVAAIARFVMQTANNVMRVWGGILTGRGIGMSLWAGTIDQDRNLARLKRDFANIGVFRSVEVRRRKDDGEDPNAAIRGPPVVQIEKVEVKIETEHLDDPARVATAWEQILRTGIEFPRSSRVGRAIPKPA